MNNYCFPFSFPFPFVVVIGEFGTIETAVVIFGARVTIGRRTIGIFVKVTIGVTVPLRTEGLPVFPLPLVPLDAVLPVFPLPFVLPPQTQVSWANDDV